jgi:hypothetical protein
MWESKKKRPNSNNRHREEAQEQEKGDWRIGSRRCGTACEQVGALDYVAKDGQGTESRVAEKLQVPDNWIATADARPTTGSYYPSPVLTKVVILVLTRYYTLDKQTESHHRGQLSSIAD